MSRLFIAVTPPEEILDRIARLERPDERGVRYTGRHQWHVTLRFLGEADPREAVEALGRLEAEPVEVVLGPEVTRLGRHVVVVPAEGLAELAAAVGEVTADIGRPPDTRPFAGHLTIARLKRRGSGRVVGAPLEGRFTAGRVELISSELGPDGPLYETVATRALGTRT